MLKAVRLGSKEYYALKALAKERGQFLTYLLNQAVRNFLAAEQSKDKAA